MALFKKARQAQEPKSLAPILHVVDSLKDYQQELVQKEVVSLWELSVIGRSFEDILNKAGHFQSELRPVLLQYRPVGGAVHPGAQRRLPVGGYGPGGDGGAEAGLRPGPGGL